MIHAEPLIGLAVVLALGCSGASRPTPGRPAASQPAVVVKPCAQALAVAEGLVADGRLWQARRALSNCQTGGALQAKLAAIDDTLGGHRLVTAPLDASAVTAAVSQIEQAIQGGSCEQALTEAAQLYDRASPASDAALLAGEAASCLGRKPEARRWYARAMLELDNAQTAASWRTLPVPRELRWLTSRSARLDTWGGHVTLGSDDGKTWIARQDQRIERGEPLCHAGDVVVELNPDSLYARELPSNEQLWYLRVGDNARVLQTLGDQLLVIEPIDAGLVVKRVDCSTGRVLAQANAKAHAVGRRLVASRYTDWVIVQDERAARALGYLLIDGKLRIRRFETPFACVPLAAWSSHEYLSGCGDARQLFAVDFSSLQARPLAQLPEGFQLDRANSVVPELVSLSGNGLLLLRGATSGAEVKVIAPLTSSSWEAEWSPDGQRLGGVASDENGRALALIWNAKQDRVELDWPGYSAAIPHHSYGPSPGSAIRIASSFDRHWLALATADEARSFDLSAGTTFAFGLPPGHAAPALLAAPDGFAVIADHGSVSLWQPSSAPTLAPHVQLVAPEALTYSGGPWLIGQPLGARGSVALNPRAGTSIPIAGGALMAFAPDGAYLAYQVDGDTLGLARLDAATGTMTEVWRRGAGAGQSHVVFSRDGRTLFFSEGALGAPRVWKQLVLSSLEVRPEARDLSEAVDFDASGRRWVTWNGQLRELGAAPRRLEDVGGYRAENPRFVADDQLVAAGALDGARLWRASDGSFVGELLPLARGGALFTTRPLPHKEEQGSTELVELMGDRASERLTCILKKRFYPWEVCADRFEQPGLLADRLTRSSSDHN